MWRMRAVNERQRMIKYGEKERKMITSKGKGGDEEEQKRGNDEKLCNGRLYSMAGWLQWQKVS